ncbi:MAG: sarcosine oxidase subunit gamma [Acetobacteraceae bacterium]
MPPDQAVGRSGPLEQLASAGDALLGTLPPAARFILRGRAPVVAAAAAAFGAALPQQACRATVAGDRAALWLGPDEWLLLAPDAEGAALGIALEQAMKGLPHALADVSHRQVGIAVAGQRAASVLNAGCPLDLDPSTFPLGMCTRTVLAKTGIVLWRTAPLAFRIEVWRSFAAYAWRFLAEASREFRE